MKKIITLLCVMLITGCGTLLNFQEIPEVVYINSNKNNISSVIVHKTTLGSNDCYNVNINDAYRLINKIKIKRKSNMSVTDDYLTYTFNFNDETSKSISFEGKYLISNKESYTINNYPKIELKEENIVGCE